MPRQPSPRRWLRRSALWPAPAAGTPPVLPHGLRGSITGPARRNRATVQPPSLQAPGQPFQHPHTAAPPLPAPIPTASQRPVHAEIRSRTRPWPTDEPPAAPSSDPATGTATGSAPEEAGPIVTCAFTRSPGRCHGGRQTLNRNSTTRSGQSLWRSCPQRGPPAESRTVMCGKAAAVRRVPQVRRIGTSASRPPPAPRIPGVAATWRRMPPRRPHRS